MDNLTIGEKIKLRGLIHRITTSDLPNKPKGEDIENMTERYLAYCNWQENEGCNLLSEFINNKIEKLKCCGNCAIEDEAITNLDCISCIRYGIPEKGDTDNWKPKRNK